MALAFFESLSNIFGRKKVEQPYAGFYKPQALDKKLLKEDFLMWYKKNPFVFWAIQERAKAVSNVKFLIDKDGELIENDITAKLNNPNAYQSQQNFLIQDLTYQSIWGTGYWYVNKLLNSREFVDDKTNILNLSADKLIFVGPDGKPYDGDYVADLIRRDKEKGIDTIRCKYVVSDTDVLDIDIENLLPFFDTSTFTNPYYSESRLKALHYVVSNSQAALESNNTFLSNPGGIGAWVSRKKDATFGTAMLTDKERKEMETAQQMDYGSLGGQRNIQIIGTDVDYISTIPKIADLKLNDTLVSMGLTIFGLFGLPKEAFTALMNGATFENQREAYKNFIESEAKNLVDDRVNSLNKNLGLTEQTGKLVGSYSHLAVMQEDEELKSKVHKTNAETLEKEKAVWDDWLEKGMVSKADYKEKFRLT